MAQLERDATMNMFKALTASAAMAVVLAGAGVAQATTLVSNFTQDGSSHGLGVAAPYGQVVVNDAGGTLAFAVTLFDGLKFGSTWGSSDSFGFNLGNLSATIGNIANNGDGHFSNSNGSTNSPFGSFTMALDCWGCSYGYDSDAPSVLSFTVSKYGTALTVADLTKNSKDEYFTANVNTHDLSANIGANSLKAAVPEPSTWLIMLLGFSGLGAALRHRRQQTLAFA